MKKDIEVQQEEPVIGEKHIQTTEKNGDLFHANRKVSMNKLNCFEASKSSPEQPFIDKTYQLSHPKCYNHGKLKETA